MEEKWYEIILEDLEDLGETTFTELVEDGEFFEDAKKILNPTREMWDWDEFDLIHKIFTEAYV